MAIDAWLDDAPSEALQAFYQKLPPEIGRTLERARQRMRDGYVGGLVAAPDALAGHVEFSFKDWCLAVGINYSTAKSIVARAKQASEDENAPPLAC